ncbi:hypothetical protein H0H87_010315 [Tephrocybe sp. NHM501043]|nr:hypothetical protein H0H87_010315 [Tephrocybe sp. NHM501043]
MISITSGQISILSAEEKREWDISDEKLSEYIYGQVSDEYQHLIKDSETGSPAWKMALQSAKQKLTTFGVTINNTEFKDVLLMNFADFFHTICLNILTQLTEPDLTKIKAMLTSSSATDHISIKSSLAVQGHSSARSSDDFVDEKGHH